MSLGMESAVPSCPPQSMHQKKNDGHQQHTRDLSTDGIRVAVVPSCPPQSMHQKEPSTHPSILSPSPFLSSHFPLSSHPFFQATPAGARAAAGAPAASRSATPPAIAVNTGLVAMCGGGGACPVNQEKRSGFSAASRSDRAARPPASRPAACCSAHRPRSRSSSRKPRWRAR